MTDTAQHQFLYTCAAVIVCLVGVPDALNPQDEEYGEERLRALLQRVAPMRIHQ